LMCLTNMIDPYNILFIVMENDKDRVNHTHQTLNEYNLNASIYPAIVGMDNLVHYYKQNYLTENAWKTMRSGAIGCGLAHITLLEQFVKSGKPHMTVFEDDAEFDKNFITLYKSFLNNLPSDAEFCQLLHHVFQIHLKDKPEYKLNDHVLKAYPQAGLVGYYVTRKGAIKILASVKPMTKPIDNMIADMIESNKLKAYIPKNNLIYMPYKFKSNIWTTQALTQHSV